MCWWRMVRPSLEGKSRGRTSLRSVLADAPSACVRLTGTVNAATVVKAMTYLRSTNS